jgi:hypothetical protein
LTFCIDILYYIFNKGVKGGEEERNAKEEIMVMRRERW